MNILFEFLFAFSLFAFNAISDWKCPKLVWVSARGNVADQDSFKLTKSVEKNYLKALGFSNFKISPYFPTDSVANEYTQVTGLKPEEHKIFSTKMTRRSNGEIFTPESTNEWWWNWNNEIKPIWLINDQIEGHASLVKNWPGISAMYSTKTLRYFSELKSSVFNTSSTNEGKFIGDSIDLKEFNLIMSSIKNFAKTDIFWLITTNIMISSSHGYKMIDKESIIYFENMENVSMPSSFIKAGAMLFLEPPLNSNSKEYVELLNNLYGNKLIAKLTTEIFPSWSDEIDKRISSIIVIPNCGILILEKIQDVIYSLTLIKKIEEKEDGYLYNNCPEMGGYLLAKGPNINYYGDLKDLTNIDVYILACRILGVEKQCISNHQSSIQQIYIPDSISKWKYLLIYYMLPIIIVSLLLVAIIGSMCFIKKSKKRLRNF